MLNIISNTPIWVFFLFFFLLILGFTQIKDRKISFKRALVLPYIMIVLSFFGVLSAFGLSFNTILVWLLGIFFGVGLNSLLKFPRESFFIKEENLFFIKGSIIPLGLIMAIFFTKYFVGVVRAKELTMINEIWFMLLISFLYGFFSGIFFGRLFILKKMINSGSK